MFCELAAAACYGGVVFFRIHGYLCTWLASLVPDIYQLYLPTLVITYPWMRYSCQVGPFRTSMLPVGCRGQPINVRRMSVACRIGMFFTRLVHFYFPGFPRLSQALSGRYR